MFSYYLKKIRIVCIVCSLCALGMLLHCALIVRVHCAFSLCVLCALCETVVRSLCALIARSGCAQCKTRLPAQRGCTMQNRCALCAAQRFSQGQRSNSYVAQWFRHCAYSIWWTFFIRYSTCILLCFCYVFDYVLLCFAMFSYFFHQSCSQIRPVAFQWPEINWRNLKRSPVHSTQVAKESLAAVSGTGNT